MLTIQVGMETEGFAIHDSMMQLKNEVGFSSKITMALWHLLFSVMGSSNSIKGRDAHLQRCYFKKACMHATNFLQDASIPL
jgi:hypothetical protein